MQQIRLFHEHRPPLRDRLEDQVAEIIRDARDLEGHFAGQDVLAPLSAVAGLATRRCLAAAAARDVLSGTFLAEARVLGAALGRIEDEIRSGSRAPRSDDHLRCLAEAREHLDGILRRTELALDGLAALRSVRAVLDDPDAGSAS